MGLIDRVYKIEPDNSVYDISPFWFFRPDATVLKHKSLVRPISDGESDYFINQIRSDFCPGLGNKETEEHFRDAIKRGVRAINELSKEYLGKDYPYFFIEEFDRFDSFSLFKEARESYIKSKDGKHGGKRDHEAFYDAYSFARAWGLGRMILNIDTSPEVLNAVKYGKKIKEWFNDTFGFRKPTPSNIEDFPDYRWRSFDRLDEEIINGLDSCWRTNIESINVYGTNDHPIRCRTKVLDEEEIDEEGNLKYGSILIKMFRGKKFMDGINDHFSVEFIVKDDETREKLLSYFRGRRGGGGNLERFKHPGDRGKEKRNSASSEGFNATKFVLRAPIEIPPIFPFSERSYERTPVEVQILTLEGHTQRMTNPELRHPNYRGRQFESVFPLWFPKEVYEPLLKDVA